MIAPLEKLNPVYEWGSITDQFAGQPGGAALAAGILGRWVQSEHVEARLKLLYSGTVADRYGWKDRHLIWEDYMNRQGLPLEASEALLSIPGSGSESEWILISSPVANAVGVIPWRARTYQGLIDALRISWAAAVCTAMEQGTDITKIDAGALLLTVNRAERSGSGGPDPQIVKNPEDLAGIAERFHFEPKESDPCYDFGRLYNRLLTPVDPFSYLDIIASDEASKALLEWQTAADAVGYPDSIRRKARISMEELSRSEQIETLSIPKSYSTPAVRQLSGSASARGRAVAVIWNPYSGVKKPDGPYIIVCGSWEPSLETHLEGAAGLIEKTGGRGGPGAYFARLKGIPSVCELSHAQMLPPGCKAEIDGGTGIVTVV